MAKQPSHPKQGATAKKTAKKSAKNMPVTTPSAVNESANKELATNKSATKKAATREFARRESVTKELKTKPEAQKRDAPALVFVPARERRARGKSRRAFVPRESQAVWSPSPDRRDPIAVLEASNRGRIAELIPIRYGRMMKSPFTFFRGSAALMAMDLATTPVTGLQTQLCGDCHLLNFGGYATPERNVIIDINDFDETIPGPWEWDLKRLATSFVLACRGNGFQTDVCREAAEMAARSYRKSMRGFSEMPAIDVWYSKMDIESFLNRIGDKDYRKDAEDYIEKAKSKSAREYYVPRLITPQDGRHVFADNPPLLYHTEEQREIAYLASIEKAFDHYKDTLSEARRVLLDRYTLMDAAIKVVGIGSVGTFCAVLLLMADDNDPLILQVKEARNSVLEPYVGKCMHKHQGERVVAGQRLMQAHGDIFLGWTKGPRGREFYLRQLRDMKMSPMPELWTPARAVELADSFGWVLARAHARAGDPAEISGYMGSKDVLDQAIAEFAVAYADQTERDHRLLLGAIRAGRIEAYIER
jgi:uncharacterized protein (DUF2252 family)